MSQTAAPRRGLAVLLVSACAVLTGDRSFVAIAWYDPDAGHAMLGAPVVDRYAHAPAAS